MRQVLSLTREAAKNSFVAKKHDMSRNEEDEQKARKRSLSYVKDYLRNLTMLLACFCSRKWFLGIPTSMMAILIMLLSVACQPAKKALRSGRYDQAMAKSVKKLTGKELLFVLEYLKDYNGSRSYAKTYPDSNPANAYQNCHTLLKKCYIQKYIKEYKAELKAR